MISFLILFLQISSFSNVYPIEKSHFSRLSPSNQIQVLNSSKSFLPGPTDAIPKKRLFLNFSKPFSFPVISLKISRPNKFLEAKNSSSSLIHKEIPEVSFSNIESLSQFVWENNSRNIHNRALKLLQSENKEPALLLLRRNFYHNLFFPSYFVISELNEPVSFHPFLWHISLFLLSLSGCFLLLLYFLKPQPLFLKFLGGNFFIFTFTLLIGFFLLKERASPLQETAVHSLPFSSSSVEMNVTANADLVILKKDKDWVRVESSDKQIGWIPKQSLFQTF